MKNNNLKEYIGLTAGTLICALGFSLFLIPFKASPGGVGGLSQILYYFLNIPAGISMLIINIPLFFVGLKAFGKKFGIKTLYAMVTLSAFTDLLSPRLLMKSSFLKSFFYEIGDKAWSVTNDPILAVLFGAAICGVGFGLVIKYNGSTGGTDIPALLLRRQIGLSIGEAYIYIDTLIIFIMGILFRDGNLILYGLFALMISSKACDYILEGYSTAKRVLIETNKANVLIPEVEEHLKREINKITLEPATEEKKLLICTVHRRELPKLKRLIRAIDPNSFVSISDIDEALGRGFKEI